MSKSIGNVFSISSALEKFSSDSLRMFLSSHYRSPLIFSDSAVNSQKKHWIDFEMQLKLSLKMVKN